MAKEDIEFNEALILRINNASSKGIKFSLDEEIILNKNEDSLIKRIGLDESICDSEFHKITAYMYSVMEGKDHHEVMLEMLDNYKSYDKKLLIFLLITQCTVAGIKQRLEADPSKNPLKEQLLKMLRDKANASNNTTIDIKNCKND